MLEALIYEANNQPSLQALPSCANQQTLQPLPPGRSLESKWGKPQSFAAHNVVFSRGESIL